MVAVVISLGVTMFFVIIARLFGASWNLTIIIGGLVLFFSFLGLSLVMINDHRGGEPRLHK